MATDNIAKIRFAVVQNHRRVKPLGKILELCILGLIDVFQFLLNPFVFPVLSMRDKSQVPVKFLMRNPRTLPSSETETRRESVIYPLLLLQKR